MRRGPRDRGKLQLMKLYNCGVPTRWTRRHPLASKSADAQYRKHCKKLVQAQDDPETACEGALAQGSPIDESVAKSVNDVLASIRGPDI